MVSKARVHAPMTAFEASCDGGGVKGGDALVYAVVVVASPPIPSTSTSSTNDPCNNDNEDTSNAVACIVPNPSTSKYQMHTGRVLEVHRIHKGSCFRGGQQRSTLERQGENEAPRRFSPLPLDEFPNIHILNYSTVTTTTLLS
jgi:hypothetical protein